MRVNLKQWRSSWLVATALIGLSVGIVTAYFTSTGWLRGQVLGTSSLVIRVEQIEPQAFVAFTPGEPQPFTWKVTNVGDVAVHLAARFTGNWEKTGLDPALFTLNSIRYKVIDDPEWQTLSRNAITFNQPWFISPTGQDVELLELAPGEELNIQGEMMLADEADDRYQMTEYSFVLQVVAKQLTQGATWPEYE